MLLRCGLACALCLVPESALALDGSVDQTPQQQALTGSLVDAAPRIARPTAAAAAAASWRPSAGRKYTSKLPLPAISGSLPTDCLWLQVPDRQQTDQGRRCEHL